MQKKSDNVVLKYVFFQMIFERVLMTTFHMLIKELKNGKNLNETLLERTYAKKQNHTNKNANKKRSGYAVL